MVQRWTSYSVRACDNGGFVAYGDYLSDLRKAVEAEREACAQVCEGLFTTNSHPMLQRAADICSDEIRARGNK